MMCKSPDVPYKTSCCIDQLCSTCDMRQTWISSIEG